MIVIDIAQDYTKTPGGRFINEGKFSGEEFREKSCVQNLSRQNLKRLAF